MHDSMMAWIGAGNPLGLGSAGALALIFFVASFVFVPRTLLCLGVGALLGPPSILIILPSTTLGGVLAFLSARYLLKDRVQAMINRRPGLRKIAAAVDEEGWRIVALLRFASPLPNAVQNYLFGLTHIGIVPFVVATFVFTIPQVVLYVFLGSAGRAMLDDDMSTLNRTLLGLGAVSVAAVVLLVVRRVRRYELPPSEAAHWSKAECTAKHHSDAP